MIYFIGDSFTWGQGLHLEKWSADGITNKYMADHMPDNNFPQECLSYDDHKIRKELHFPNLVAKHFDRDYVTDWHNGGTNYTALRFLTLVTGSPIQDLIVFQFTSPTRIHYPIIPPPTPKGFPDNCQYRDDFPSELKTTIDDEFKHLNVKEYIQKITKGDETKYEVYKLAYEQAYLVNHLAPHNSNNGITWIGFGWWPETGHILKEYFPQNYVPLYYKGKEHSGFESLLDLDNLKLKNLLKGCPDEHLSSIGNQVIAESIIQKIKKDNLFENNRVKQK
tara:strand:- start:1064 stop:1897 length:834 start_codon:yes stop_codon:yes gene_type:complete